MTNATSIRVRDLEKYLSLVSVELPAPDNLRTGNMEEINQVAPAKPGIYAIFYADSTNCFYVGASVNSIRSRLSMHFGKDARENYRGKLSVLLQPQKFRFWFCEITQPAEVDKQHFKCIVTALEAMCSASWNPEVTSRKF